jgi:CcmD family protein
MSNLGFLFTGFAVVWMILGVYIVIVGRRQAGLRGQIERLEREVREME